jgi:hypothetical protein
MDLPPYGQEVLATLADGTVIAAYWKDGSWWQGIADDPNDWLVEAEVISWEWRTD